MNGSVRELFARRVRALRADRSWSQEQLAAVSGLDRTYIGALERCEKAATLDTVEKIAGAFGVSLRQLFET